MIGVTPLAPLFCRIAYLTDFKMLWPGSQLLKLLQKMILFTFMNGKFLSILPNMLSASAQRDPGGNTQIKVGSVILQSFV